MGRHTHPREGTVVPNVTRREFAAAAAALAVTTPSTRAAMPDTPPPDRDYPAPKFTPKFAKPLVDLTLARDFVLFCHYDLDMAKKLLEKEPALVTATVDWGGGDYESGLGGASHLGNREIIAFLLSKGARMDVFTAAALGLTPVVKGMIAACPELVDARGPHGIPLVMHAKMGGDKAKETLDYLVTLRPLPAAPAKKPAGPSEPRP